jgi:hypothetical protein
MLRRQGSGTTYKEATCVLISYYKGYGGRTTILSTAPPPGSLYIAFFLSAIPQRLATFWPLQMATMSQYGKISVRYHGTGIFILESPSVLNVSL